MRTKIATFLFLILIAFLYSSAALAQGREGGLVWYTDLDAAKAAARAAGKPILSLRLLGPLDAVSSDADGRFFRTVLYQDPAIHQILRDRYVLHWRSVRPAPRTLAGTHSIHYILDSRGRLLEPLPGLYGPAAFQNALEEGVRAQTDTAAHLDDEQFRSWTIGRRKSELELRSAAFQRDLKAAYPEAETDPDGPLHVKVFQANPGTLTNWLHPGDLSVGGNEVPLAANESQLHRLAELRRPHLHLDPASRAALLREQGVTDPRQAERLVDALESDLAFDEVIHQYRVGPAILKALNDPKIREGFELEAFNDWVYQKIFNTPVADLPPLTRKVEGNGC
ncbi:MAG TPA: hypothetical protein VIE43_02780 [Thermoanaerobaculia bacterium]|nr:hypothetical protein [Thermoanaerobaculia bacterium]